MLQFNLLFNSSGFQRNHIRGTSTLCLQVWRSFSVSISMPTVCSHQLPEESEPVKRSTRSAAKAASGRIKVSWLSLLALISLYSAPLRHLQTCYFWQAERKVPELIAIWLHLTLPELGRTMYTMCVGPPSLPFECGKWKVRFVPLTNHSMYPVLQVVCY